MRLSAERVRKACGDNGLTLSAALEAAGVSRTAYYSLLRSDSVLPTSLLALADFLGVPPTELLGESVGPALGARLLLRRVDRILAKHPGADRDTVRHTLLLLDEPPTKRLERGLTRGRALDHHA